ncbi:phosphate ABC transporter permease PstA [Halorhodospira halophila]|uniref:Phosphate transport system permease protein PstA n=1 Tax=Halorhodospira halophila (strain DSM 244 / SL1) TaxID=349124 RepID=A1WT77_HALHL|nr:phosphate ABC transporter permease PstA [Halorhodospira halophila]ABM60889.1 phosphate ABC transporter membrane protein 2, PhoT family [Halorhodospira halophila SL1]MBK1728544.1 phosphate ABC transporter, permease protein PstA [Halorhodospira halophila]
MRDWFRQGTPWIWLNAGAVAVSLVMVFGLIGHIAYNGLQHFWPSDVIAFEYDEPGREPVAVMGEVDAAETLTTAAARERGFQVEDDDALITRYRIKRGNRDVDSRDFVWYADVNMSEWAYPEDAVVIERRQWGDFIGYLRDVRIDGERVEEVSDQGDATWDRFLELYRENQSRLDEIQRIERVEIGAVNAEIEEIRLSLRQIEADPSLSEEERTEQVEALEAERDRWEAEYAELEERRDELLEEVGRYAVGMETAAGEEVVIAMGDVVKPWRPNVMNVWDKARFYVGDFWDFVSGYPREANTEGGILPAIFGTVLMTMVMAVFVTPFGVLAAIYLREYARQGPLTRMIRISVNNLAGVPSIVFGVFGLGFFVYFVGGGVDQFFFSERLPAPTFGKGGVLWASLTLALLTLPVVIVSTEEGLSRIPGSIRQGALALGATKAEMLWRVVVPLATPAMITGLILAVARAAGEVAPLMLVGVVKLAPQLPVDGSFPYVHLERSFMHLGFHIFDVGFQSPNVEAGRPLVYATALILVLVIIVLNLTAMSIRNLLREKYKAQGD